MAVGRGGWKVFPESLYGKAKDPGAVLLKESRDHAGDFVNAVLTREPPVSDLESAVRSDLVSQLSDISIRVGRPLTWDPEKETIVGDEEAAQRMARPMRAPWTLRNGGGVG